MFAAIAPSYDALNRVISLNFDRRWRRLALGQLNWQRAPRGTYLDLCAGTLDFAALMAKLPGFEGRVVGADFVPEMLRQGLTKADGLEPVTADALDLPFADATFDGLTVGWGARNLADLDAGLVEMRRVLKPGARVAILDMAIPTHQPLRALFLFYFEHILPVIGRAVSKHSTAYEWLPQSTHTFPVPEALARRIASAGFRDVQITRFMGGVSALLVGVAA
jgi:demethylmenaquinone methyltransferase/2-methoxy-6-polyprenyl-1,4-benzoquinol methylase